MRDSRHMPGRLLAAIVIMASTFGGAAFARQELAILTPSDGPDDVWGFGKAVAISGDYVVVGAPDADMGFGAAYVFKREGANWVEQIKLPPEWFTFGYSVAIEGEVLVVGAPFIDLDGSGSGRAFVFRRDGVAWVQEAEIIPSGAALEDGFGMSVSISGDLIAVGASGTGVSLAFGRVYVFRHEGTSWIEHAELVGSDTELGNLFGGSVSIDGDVLVVGAPRYNVGGAYTGAVYVFRRDGSIWLEEGKFTASAQEGHRFGASVSVSSTTFVAGRIGGAHIFRYDGVDWVEDHILVEPASEFEWTPAIEGERIVAGGFASPNRGHLFMHAGETWIHLDNLVASDGWSGPPVAISGAYAVLGGGVAAYVYSAEGSIPTVSVWGMSVMTLIVLTAATILLRRARHPESIPRGVG